MQSVQQKAGEILERATSAALESLLHDVVRSDDTSERLALLDQVDALKVVERQLTIKLAEIAE